MHIKVAVALGQWQRVHYVDVNVLVESIRSFDVMLCFIPLSCMAGLGP